MTDRAPWLDVIARLTPQAPDDLDDLLPPVTAPGTLSHPGGRAPAPELWQRENGTAHIGIRVTRAGCATPAAALRLAAAAVERGVVPVILSHVPASGFERFGLRCERIPAENAAAAEEEIAALWNLAIVIDLDEIGDLG